MCGRKKKKKQKRKLLLNVNENKIILTFQLHKFIITITTEWYSTKNASIMINGFHT